MKKSLILILVLVLLCTMLCACGKDDKGSGNVSGNENGIITDEHNGDDIVDKAGDAMESDTPDAQNTAIPGGNDGNGNGQGKGQDGSKKPTTTQPVTP